MDKPKPDRKYYDMIPTEALDNLAEIFEFGEKRRGYIPNEWENESYNSHAAKALTHLASAIRNIMGVSRSGDDEDHLGMALWRTAIVATLLRRKRKECHDIRPWFTVDPNP